MSATPPIITLLTDFGTQDGYVGAMKGVIHSVLPHTVIADITHDIPHADIPSGAWALRGILNLFPAGTIHVAVVDPGVGTERHALLLEADSQWYIGPDNGLFSWILSEAGSSRAWQLSEAAWRPGGNSHTFHGRDLFAHAAALFARDRDPNTICGKEVTPQFLEWATLHLVQEDTTGEFIHIDRFGNAISNLLPPPDPYDPGWKVEVPSAGLQVASLSRTYGEMPEGTPLALIGSHGCLEIAVRNGSAAAQHGLHTGDPIRMVRQ